MYPDSKKKLQTSTVLFTFTMVMFYPFFTEEGDHFITSSSQENLTLWKPGWLYRKLLTIDHTKVSANLRNFPVLIAYSSDAELADATQPKGQDIVFVQYSDNSTILNHEIEYYNHTTGQLIAWVNMTMISATIDTKL